MPLIRLEELHCDHCKRVMKRVREDKTVGGAAIKFDDYPDAEWLGVGRWIQVRILYANPNPMQFGSEAQSDLFFCSRECMTQELAEDQSTLFYGEECRKRSKTA